MKTISQRELRNSSGEIMRGLVPQGVGQLQIEAGTWGGDVLLELRDDGVLEARFQYSPFDCGGVPHAKVVVAALSR